MIETAIITTTINIPFFLNKILQNVLKEKKNKKIITIVIGDKKTPKKINQFCKKIEKNPSYRRHVTVKGLYSLQSGGKST